MQGTKHRVILYIHIVDSTSPAVDYNWSVRDPTFPDMIQHTDKRCWVLGYTIVRPSSEQVVVDSVTLSILQTHMQHSSELNEIIMLPHTVLYLCDLHHSQFIVNVMVEGDSLHYTIVEGIGFTNILCKVLLTLDLDTRENSLLISIVYTVTNYNGNLYLLYVIDFSRL